jgi:hypothetical protein
MLFDQVTKYPEWKQLLSVIRPLIQDEHQKEFSYDKLKELCGLDVRTWRGRAQFYKCRKELLREMGVWLENLSSFGYVVIDPGDHPKASLRRVRHARRKVAMGRMINELARVEEMTPEQRALQAQTAVLLYDLSQTFNRVSRQFAQAAGKLHLSVTDDDVKKIAEAPSKEKVIVTS